MKKELKAGKTKEKPKFAIWKVVVATLCSVLGAIGIIFLGLYFTGAFSNEKINPEGLFFADVTIGADGKKTYTSRGSTPYNVSDNFEIVISTSTTGANQNEVELSFPKGKSSSYVISLKEGETEADFAGSNTKFFYSEDSDGQRIVFVSCPEEKAEYVTDGIIIVPRYVTLNKSFEIKLAQEDEEGRIDFTKTFSAETKLYNVGGYSQLVATSVSSKLAGSVSIGMNIDVPVDSISMLGITGNNLSQESVAGYNEEKLVEKDGIIEVGIEGPFSVILDVTPSRAIYKYGKDGTNGVAEYKKVIFSLGKDVNNAGPKISFADNLGNENSNTLQEGRAFTFSGLESLGTSLITKSITGEIKLEARIFKSASIEDEVLKTGLTQIGDFDSVLRDETKGVSAEQIFLIKEIPIEGFEITDEYKGEVDDDPTKSALTIDINYPTIIYANKPGDKSLGIQIESSQGPNQIQNKIKNILVSIQYLIDDTWYDATKTNIVGGYRILPMYEFHADHQVVTENDLYISETNSLYYFNFFRPKYINASNLSYWEVWGTPVAETVDAYGISAVAIKVYYLNPDTGLVLDDAQNYGPFGVGSGASEVIQPLVDWNESDEIKTSKELGIANYNERVFIKNTVDYAQYNKINLSDLQIITNISSNPTYKTTRFFVYTTQKIGTEYVDLEKYLNVKKYSGVIPGVSGAIFEVNAIDNELIISDLDIDYIEFNLIFAVVEHGKSTSPTLYDGSYRIITVPTETLSGNIVSCPIRISKTLSEFEVSVVSGTITPYGNIDERVFFMQNKEKSLGLNITIDKNDDTLFAMLARKGEIKLLDNGDVYCSVGSRNVALSEILSVIFSSETPETTYSDILSKSESAGKITYTILLSTNILEFDADTAEKFEQISIEYRILANNLKESDKVQNKSTSFYIYSGKIINANFGTAEQQAVNVNVDKTINDGNFETSISGDTVAFEKAGEGYYLNVYIDGFGFADSYTVTSSSSNVVLKWDATKGKYSVSFIGEGTSSLKLSLAYPHKDYVEKTLNVNVTSSYTTIAEFVDSTSDSRVLSYNSTSGYQILGLSGAETINLKDLIKITAIPNGSETGTEITELFNISLVYDDAEEFETKVEIVKDALGEIVGLKFKENFGAMANVIVFASSVEIGVAFQFNIIIKPNVELKGTSSSHSGLSSSEINTYAVYCEADVNFINFGLYEYNIVSGSYSTNSINPLYYSLYKDGVLVDISNYATLTKSGENLSKIMFKAKSGSYTLVVSDVADPGTFDLRKEFKFVVYSNIKLDEGINTETKKENISYTNSSDEQIVLENVDVYNLNNEVTPVLNGKTISISGNKIIFEGTGLEINISRIYGENSFDAELLRINETETTFTVENAKSLEKRILRICYGDSTLYVSYYVAPNITVDENHIVKYDGKDYIKLYCGQVVTNAKSWFKYNGSESSSLLINFGQIATGTIDSVPSIYSKVNSVNLIENGTQYFVNKTVDGFVITQIVVSVGTGESREYRIFDALISPIDLDNFLTYDGSETGEDWKEILAGKFTKEIVSGSTQGLDSFLKNIDSYYGKTGSTLNYKLLRETSTGDIEITGGVSFIERVNGILQLKTQPVAYDFNYKIVFTYIVRSESYSDAIFTFNYYIKITKNQEIQIFYPYGSDGTTLEDNDPTVAEKELYPEMTISESFETNRKQIVYFDEFYSNEYVIDLTKSAYNFNSNYVKVLVGGTAQDQNINTPSYNKLKFEVYKIFENGIETDESNFSNYISISEDGVVTLKKPTQTIWIMIRVYTTNGAENYYRLVVRERPSNVHVTVGTTTYTSSVIDEPLAIVTDYQLSQLTVNSAVGEVSYKIVDEYGIEQTSSNMIYLDENKIIVKSSPNSQNAYLIVYNETFGTVAKIKVLAESPIVVTFDQGGKIYSDSIIDLTNYLSIAVNGKPVGDKSSLHYLVDWNGEVYNFVQSTTYSYSLETYPISTEKTIKFRLKIWGDALTGTSEENPCLVECTLKITPKVTPKADVTTEITAGGQTTINLSDLFETNETIGNDYIIETSYVWDGDVENETLTITHDGETTRFTDSITIKVSNISAKRTATITVKVYRKDAEENVLGEVITATCKLNIKPKYSVTIKYPDYGTGNSQISAEAIYIGNKNGINLLENDRVTIDGESVTLIFVSTNTSLIEIVEVENGVIIKIKDGASVTFNTNVMINIFVASGMNDGKQIALGSYKIIVSPDEILTAEFGEKGSGVTYKNEVIVDTSINSGSNPFDGKDGYLKLETKQGTENNFFKLILQVTPKYAYFPVPDTIKDIVIYGAGTENAGYPLIFISTNKNVGGIKSSIIASLGTVTSVDILGSESDNDICAIEGGSLKFKQAGTWIARIEIQGETNPITCLVVSEVDGLSYKATYYKNIELDSNNRLMFSKLFGDIDKDMFNFVINSSKVENIDIIKDFGLTQPESLLNFYYNVGEEAYRIPYSVAKDVFTFKKGSDTSGTSISGAKYVTTIGEETTLKISNEQGREVAVYVYTLVNDFSFNEENIEKVTKAETGITSDKGLNEYEEAEFAGYGDGDYEVSKLIEINAGSTYNLISLLQSNLGLKTFNGGDFIVKNIKFDITLSYGKFTTNENFKTNLSSLIGVVSVGDNDYSIVPHGAKNNGDIVHLTLEIGGRTIILRFKINPIVKIQSLSSTGEKVVNSEKEVTNIPLSELITATGVDVSRLQVAIVAGLSDGYVMNSGSTNCMAIVNEDGAGLEKYGVQLKPTILGGATITFKIFDEYGYQVTDSTGTPTTIRIYYRTEFGAMVNIDKYNSFSTIFEGATIEIWTRVDDYTEDEGKTTSTAYYKWEWNDEKEKFMFVKEQIDPPSGNVILLENISFENISNITINFDYSNSYKSDTGKTGITDFTVDYLKNTLYQQEQKTGNNFKITITAESESINESTTFEIDATIKQRYKLKFADEYSAYNELYLSYNTEDTDLIGTYVKIWDNENNKFVEDGAVTVGGLIYRKKITGAYEFSNNIVVGGTDFETSQEITYTITISGTTIGDNKYILNYKLTTPSTSLDLSEANVVGTYGVVIPGESNNTFSEDDLLNKNIKLKDFYGKEVEFQKQYVGDISQESLSAGQTIYVRIYGDTDKSYKNENTLLGTIAVTRAKYYKLTNVASVTDISKNLTTVPFADSEGNGWGKCLKAIVSGTNDVFEPITAGIGGNFSYKVEEGKARILFNETLNCYEIEMIEDNVVVKVSYMNVEIGEFVVKKVDDKTTWIIEGNILPLDGIKYSIDETNKTLTINSITYSRTSYEIPSTYTIGGEIYTVVAIGEGTNCVDPDVKSIILPEGLTVIKQSAFAGCTGLTEITIPSTVTGINTWAFRNCSKLEAVEFFKGENLKISGGAFENCTSLTRVKLPSTITSIEEFAFNGCSKLNSINLPNGLTTISKAMFKDCKNLVSITIPNSVTSIGDSAFNGCTGLTTVTIGSGVTIIGENAFNGCSQLNSINLPSGLTTISNGLFYGCSSLTLIEIPDNVTSIGDSAFYGCTDLTSVTIGSGVTIIGEYAFNGCSQLNSINLPSGLTSISNGLFYGCSSLILIEIPDNVTSIGNSAFRNCTALTSIVIPDNVTNIGDSAFNGCTGLTSITISNNVTSIGQYAFYGCSSLTSLDLPGVISIGGGAFENCTSLTRVALPSTATSVGEYAFNGCSKLEIVEFNSTTPPAFGNNVFYNCSKLTTIIVPAGTKSEYVTALGEAYQDKIIEQLSNEDIEYTTSRTDLTITKVTATETSYAIPSTFVIGGTTYTVKSLRGTSSAGIDTDVVKVILPSTLTSIGKFTFYNCIGLTSITIQLV
ncbi:MAG: leucine-rich repeat protein [Christensenellales bacterium]